MAVVSPTETVGILMGIIAPPGTGGGGPPSGPAGGDLASTYPNPEIAPGAIDEGDFAAEAIPTAAIKNGAVTSAKLAEAVSLLLLGPGKVITEYLANAGVTPEKIAEFGVKAVEAVSAKLVNLSLGVVVVGGLVFFVGMAEVKEEVAAASVLFTLPPSARPEKEQHIVLVGGTLTYLDAKVLPTGEVIAITAIKVGSSPIQPLGILRLK